MSMDRVSLTVEIRSANGTSTEFVATDEEPVREALRLLAAQRLFAQPHLLLASQHCASMIPCRGIDMIIARTSSQLPIKFPLDLPAGLFDIVEQVDPWAESGSAVSEDQEESAHRRDSQVEIHTLGGWTVKLDLVATFHGNVQDERQFLSQLPNLPTIPFRLKEGGFGLINTVNIVRVSAWPEPETLSGIALPLTLLR